MPSTPTRFGVRVDRDRLRLVDPAEVFVLEADGSETVLRMAGRRKLRDPRALGELMPLFSPHGFVRVHRNHAVNLARVLELRRRDGSDDWELKMEPPVNRVLPVARGRLHDLLDLLG
jgi:DNA-binding LytR/AlgR family response regulator